MIRKAITDGERQRNKDVKNASMFRYGYALVDGHLEKVGNYNSELFSFVCCYSSTVQSFVCVVCCIQRSV